MRAKTVVAMWIGVAWAPVVGVSTCLGQTSGPFAIVSLEPSETVVRPGETFTMNVRVEIGGGAVGLSAINARITAGSGGSFSNSGSPQISPDFPVFSSVVSFARPTGDGGVDVQLAALPPIIAPAFAGGVLLSYDVTAGDSLGAFEFSLGRSRTDRGAVFVFTSLTSVGGRIQELTRDAPGPDQNVFFRNTTIFVVPAPHSGMLVVMAGAMAARRRRARPDCG